METSSPGSRIRAAAMLSSSDRLAGCLPGACDKTTVSRLRLMAGSLPRHQDTLFQADHVLAVPARAPPPNGHRLIGFELLELSFGPPREVEADHAVASRVQI